MKHPTTPSSPSNSSSRTALKSARAYATSQDWEKSLLAYHQACLLNPEYNRDADFQNDLAVALFHNSQPLEALHALNEAIQLQPHYGYRYAARAWMRQAQKDSAGAKLDYEKALELDPEDAISLNNLGLLEEQMGSLQDAKKRFQKADGIASKSATPVVDSKSPNPSKKEHLMDQTKSSTGPSGWGFVHRALFHTEGRKEFIAFLKNGFKLKP